MGEKRERGRPRRTGEPMVAFGTRLPKSEAEAFEKLVRRRSKAATGSADGLSTAIVLRAVMRAAVEAEGITVKASEAEEEAEEDPDPAPEPIVVMGGIDAGGRHYGPADPDRGPSTPVLPTPDELPLAEGAIVGPAPERIVVPLDGQKPGTDYDPKKDPVILRAQAKLEENRRQHAQQPVAGARNRQKLEQHGKGRPDRRNVP